MYIKYKYLILIFTSSLCPFLSSQELTPSFNPENQIYHNITQTINNFNDGYKLGLSYRNQWQGLSDQIGFNTIQMNGQAYLYNSQLDQWIGGFTFIHDKGSSGSLQNNLIQVHGRYRRLLPLKKNKSSSLHIQFGAGLRLGAFNIDPNNLWFGQQFDIANNSINTNLPSGELNIIENVNYWSVLFSGSASYTISKRHKVNLGFTLSNINMPNVSLLNAVETLPRTYFGILEYHNNINKQLAQEIQCMYHNAGIIQHVLWAYKMHFNINAEDSSIYLGLGNRLGKGIGEWEFNTLAFLFGMDFNDINIQFNYQSSLSEFSNNSNGGSTFELLASYRIRSN